ncbi:transcriptional regulator [Hassallia byssoidea VB512170]|uniref:Transcriptional regulator n=1 Tax=Hassallia byssoidea VB512170 TaxID=1304833 RepID=A0A846HA70_9CYAN|nr:GUN4 domain-containing protein [Hassalia byssoidea]NEU74487.1 transcriptional regulator [Hassalia byssoidea VB512170]
MPKKIALLIGVSEYGEGIPPLSSALNDVEAMQRVLLNPSLGGFEQVERLLNPTDSEMRKAIQKLFKEALKDDLVLLFFSGHGITNDDGHLYLTTRITAKDDFEATAVDANFIQGQSNNCYAKRQVLILDACYSGAIAQGWRTKSVGVDIKKQLGAEGRVVLTSSSATQTSFEQEGLPLSLYTQYLVEGIETGAADTDNDGNIHVQELHAYAKAKVQAVKPKMTPEIILDKEGFNILLAHAPKNAEAEYRKLVEQYAQNGELSKLAYLILKPKRKTFGITDKKAEEIESEVLEPFRRRFANLESYKQAFVEVVEQKYPLDEHTRKILKDYQQDILGLRDEDVAAIELEIASSVEAEYQKSAELQKQQAEEATKTTTTKPTQENDHLSSDKGVDYTHLRDLLKAEKWKQADQETRTVMLKAAGREQELWLSVESIENFPCTDLRTIEQLWVKYGNGHFGFSVQKRIWESVGKDLEKFGDRVGWQRGGEWLQYTDLTFETYAPVGHLPVAPFYMLVKSYKKRFVLWEGDVVFSSLASRLANCNI